MNGHKPVIGITATTLFAEGFDSVYLHYSYVESIRKAGGVPIVLPTGSTEEARSWVNLCDGILLSGGEDLNPFYFGEEPHPKLGRVQAERDETELDIILYASRQKKPILGLCRGIQVLNAAFGGTIIQDIESEVPGCIKHTQLAARKTATHSITIEKSSLLYEIAGEERLLVNSFHHQAVGRVADKLKVTSVSSDGVIESVEAKHPSEGWMLAVQWHPEEMIGESPVMQQLFTEFIKAASKNN
ncbi:gamma-glutamyl-gamma-aminobutyrate hydrolase family protein [Peribacillus kribbensis]|uniref:gamma-glutamyl-gamma-aminobutyrate hydrolase family protein n=1 Tax=Peribacillus kribbensis TaxID=356658 RepID=UPI0003F6F5BE|nr:gamma-glutamyl-gamma-aminobutyrate hydrolase family protein [Peribacillus kribbensis]